MNNTPEAGVTLVESERWKWASDVDRGREVEGWDRVRETLHRLPALNAKVSPLFRIDLTALWLSSKRRHINLHRTNDILDGQRWLK